MWTFSWITFSHVLSDYCCQYQGLVIWAFWVTDGYFHAFYAFPVQETAAKIASSPVLTTYTLRFILQSVFIVGSEIWHCWGPFLSKICDIWQEVVKSIWQPCRQRTSPSHAGSCHHWRTEPPQTWLYCHGCYWWMGALWGRCTAPLYLHTASRHNSTQPSHLSLSFTSNSIQNRSFRRRSSPAYLLVVLIDWVGFNVPLSSSTETTVTKEIQKFSLYTDCTY